MKRLIDIIKGIQGLILVAFILIAVLGASNLDSKDETFFMDCWSYIKLIFVMCAVLGMFELIGHALIKSYGHELRKEEFQQTEDIKVFRNRESY